MPPASPTSAAWRIAPCWRLSPLQFRRSYATPFTKGPDEHRDYGDAIAALNSIQTNFAIVDAIRKSGRGMNKQAIPEMIEWFRRVGYEPKDFDRLRPIHIAGTKGKGSTAAFVSSILNQYLPFSPSAHAPFTKVGLYTSPHLRSVRERIQINNEPISEEKFAKYFFEVWDRLEAAAKALKTPPGERTKPVYFRLLTMVALHTYMREGVDTAVLECGVGGHYDSTNVIVHPTVTAVTSLGIDHVAMLGSTLPEIAWHKAGIFKPGAPALTAPQPPEAIEVLKERAAEKGNELHTVPIHPSLANGEVNLGLSASFQKINASVAIAAAAVHLRAMGQTDVPDPISNTALLLPDEFKRALQDTRWPGRCEIRREKGIAWHIDGGHTKESIAETAKWFAEQITASTGARSSERRILIFNQQTRDAAALAKVLHQALVDGVHASDSPLAQASTVFTHVIFTNNKTFNDGFSPDLISINTNALDVESLAVQDELAKAWNDLDPHPTISIRASIEDALQDARRMAREWTKDSSDVEVPVLVTGSIHLVGGAIEVLETGRTDTGAEPKTGRLFKSAQVPET